MIRRLSLLPLTLPCCQRRAPVYSCTSSPPPAPRSSQTASYWQSCEESVWTGCWSFLFFPPSLQESMGMAWFLQIWELGVYQGEGRILTQPVPARAERRGPRRGGAQCLLGIRRAPHCAFLFSVAPAEVSVLLRSVPPAQAFFLRRHPSSEPCSL